MRQSKLFTKTRKESPKDETAKNADLLIRAGFINKEMAGVYSYLPLGLRVMKKIEGIIREEMNAIGGQEISMSALQDKDVWQKTGRWSDEIVDNWFKTKLKNGGEMGLGFTHEEPITSMLREHIRSFRDLPCFPYQFQTKFRNEQRAKSGILRGREFLMKDLYSFCKNENEQKNFYEKAKSAYVKVFDRIGLGEKTYTTFASGGTFSKYSDEFQTISDAGEDIIHICDKCHLAVNEEIFSETRSCPSCNNKDLKKEKSIEVGNIFNLGTKFSDSLGLTYSDEKGEKKPVFMGSYGIGVGRVMGTIVEVLSDEKGIIWPKNVSPFEIHLIEINNKNNSEVSNLAEKISKEFENAGLQVLHDDREITAGEKFADSDLIGIPLRVVVSEKSFGQNSFETKKRVSGQVTQMTVEEIINFFK